jgi:prevent-host-death family protein
MDIKRIIPISEARKRIFEIADEVQAPNKIYTLTADGKPKAVIMSAEEYESWLETMEVLSIFPNLDKHVAKADEAIRTGEYKKWPTLGDLKKNWGMTAADRPRKRYGVSSVYRTKSKKGNR